MEELAVIRTLAEAEAHPKDQSALVEVPGAFVKAVVWMMGALKNPGNDEVGKMVRTLLTAQKEKA